MSIPLLFSTLHCLFNQPTSTATEQSVATTYSTESGIMIAFESCDSSQYIRTLDMSLFSCFSAEYEHLIFETRLRISHIYIPSEGVWIKSNWIKRLSLYDLLMHGNNIHDKTLLNIKRQSKLADLLQSILENEKSIMPYSKSPYFMSLILSFIKNKKIWLNIPQIEELGDSLKRILIKENEFGLFVKYLINTFDVMVCPIFRTKWEMTGSAFNLIYKVSKQTDNVVLQGDIVTCNLSKIKKIKFRPEFTYIKKGGIFDVKMKLIDVFNSIPIKVHFNLECQELDNYYTSLHPRFMDIEQYNYFDISLPSIDGKLEHLESVFMDLSVMLHNFKDFDIEYKDSEALNMKIMYQNEEDLQHIALHTFQQKANQTMKMKIFEGIMSIQWLKRFIPFKMFYGENFELFVDTMLSGKSLQLFIRTIVIIPCILLDAFYLNLFNDGSVFQPKYKNVLSIFGVIGSILFLICLSFISYSANIEYMKTNIVDHIICFS